MSASFKINQDDGAGDGVADRSRRDLWVSQEITLQALSVGPYFYTLLDKPGGSTVTLASFETDTCTFTPDVRGTYRVRLVSGTGASATSIILLIGVVKNSDGSPVRGWRIPAYKEDIEEANWLISGTPNTRGNAPDLETILRDIEDVLDGISGPVALAGDVEGDSDASVVTALRGVPVVADFAASATDKGRILVTGDTEVTLSDPPAEDAQTPVWSQTAEAVSYRPYTHTRGVVGVSVTGKGPAFTLTKEETDAQIVDLTGVLAADTDITVPNEPGRMRMFRRGTTGNYTLRLLAGTGSVHLLPGQVRNLGVDQSNKLVGEALTVLELDVVVSLSSPALVAGDNLFLLCKIPGSAAVSQVDVYGTITRVGGDGTYTMSVGTASGGAGPGYDQLLVDGAIPDAGVHRGVSRGGAGSEMGSGDSYDAAARNVYLRIGTGSQTVAPSAGAVRVLLVVRWYG